MSPGSTGGLRSEPAAAAHGAVSRTPDSRPSFLIPDSPFLQAQTSLWTFFFSFDVPERPRRGRCRENGPLLFGPINRGVM